MVAASAPPRWSPAWNRTRICVDAARLSCCHESGSHVMAWYNDAAKAIKKAAKKAAKAASTVVNTVGEVASDIVESAGNATEAGLDILADKAEDIPGVGNGVASVLRWVGGVASASTSLGAATIKGASGLFGGSLSGTIKLTGAGLTFWHDRDLVVESFRDITSGATGSFLLIAGKTVGVFDATFTGETRRALTAAEKALLQRVFRDSIALYNIRLVETRYNNGFLSAFGDRPFTLGNTIYLKSRNIDTDPGLLVHECTHVWQFQNQSSSYSSDALSAQAFVPDEYNWRREIGRGNDEWVRFNLEAQARFLEDIFNLGVLLALTPMRIRPSPLTAVADGTAGGPVAASTMTALTATGLSLVRLVALEVARGNGAFYDADGVNRVGTFEYDGVDYTAKAVRAVEAVRKESTVRPSAGLD